MYLKVEGREYIGREKKSRVKVESQQQKVESRQKKVESRQQKVESKKLRVDSKKSRVDSKKSRVNKCHQKQQSQNIFNTIYNRSVTTAELQTFA